MNDIQKAFSINLKALRKKHGLTQAQAAESIGVEPLTWQNYEYGRRFPKPAIIHEIARLFKVNPQDLYGADGAPKFSLSEKTPLSEILNLFQLKTAGIPDDVINLAMNYSKEDDVWETIRGALEHGLKGKGVKKKGSKRKA